MNGLGNANTIFENQFTAHGDDFVYRKWSKGTAYRISAAERDDFVRTFQAQMRRSRWFIYAATALGILAFAAIAMCLDLDSHNNQFEISLSALLIIIAGIFVGLQMQAYVRPAKILDGRPIFAPPLSRDEARANALTKLTYQQLLGGVAVGIVLPLTAKSDIWHGWSRLYWLAPGILIPLCAIQAYRKWRLDRST